MRIPARSDHAAPPPPPPTFDPTTLPFNLAQRGSFAGAPWAGTATTGTSGTRSLVTAGADPSAGAPLNGFVPADFSGSELLFGDTSMTFADILSSSAYYVAALVFIRSASAAAGAPYQNQLIIGDDGGAMGLAVSSSGAMGFHLDSVGYQTTGWAPLSLNTWHLVEWWFDGTDIRIAVDGAQGTPAPAGNALFENLEHVRVGANFVATSIDGLLEEIWAAPTDLSAHSADMISYENARYRLSL